MCQDRVIKLLIFGLIVGLVLPECHASPHPASSISKERPGDDYEYDDEDEPSREARPENDINGGGPSRTQLLTKNHTVEAELDATVTLPCRIQNPEPNTIIMWYNMSSLLFMRNNSFTQDPRVSLEQDNAVRIQNVLASDDSIYKCTVLPIKKSVFITLKVKGPPYNIRITHGNKNYANQELELQERDRKFILHCEASGYPTPAVTWSFRGKHLTEDYAKHSGITVRKEFLEIHDVKGHHSGDFECSAQNVIGTISAVVAVQIKSSPMIVKHVEYINTAIGENTEVVCLYRSYPEARKIQWYRGDELLHNSAKFTIVNDRHNHHERTRLSIHDVEQKDLVDYVCKVENALGESSAKSILGLLPGGAHLVHSNFSDGLLHTMWRVRSAQPLSDLQILYKRTEGPKYITIEPTLSEQNKEEPGDVWSIRRSLNLPPGEWLITARARNTEGWSYAETVPFMFQIPSEVSLESQRGTGAGTTARSSLAMGFSLLLVSLLCRLF